MTSVKKAMYERFAVPEYWIVNPVALAVTVFVLRDGRYEEVEQGGAWLRSTVLPDLHLPWSDLFRDV